MLNEAEADLSVSTEPGPGDAFQGHDWFSQGFQAQIDGQTLDIALLIATFLEHTSGDYDPQALPDLQTLAQQLATRPVYVPLGKQGDASLSLAPIAPVLHLFLRRQAELAQMHPFEAPLAAEIRGALAGSDVRFADQTDILPLAEALRSLATDAPFVSSPGLCATVTLR